MSSPMIRKKEDSVTKFEAAAAAGPVRPAEQKAPEVAVAQKINEHFKQFQKDAQTTLGSLGSTVLMLVPPNPEKYVMEKDGTFTLTYAKPMKATVMIRDSVVAPGYSEAPREVNIEFAQQVKGKMITETVNKTEVIRRLTFERGSARHNIKGLPDKGSIEELSHNLAKSPFNFGAKIRVGFGIFKKSIGSDTIDMTELLNDIGPKGSVKFTQTS